jgi:hypothetical protein
MIQGQTYDQNGRVEATYETFCKEPHINYFLHHWNLIYLKSGEFPQQKEKLLEFSLFFFFFWGGANFLLERRTKFAPKEKTGESEAKGEKSLGGETETSQPFLATCNECSHVPLSDPYP